MFFAAGVVLALLLYQWPRRWLVSGAPVLTFCILLGAQKGYRILPFIDLWALLSILNLAYSVASTSWLLYGLFAASCYQAIFLTCLFQFTFAANFVRTTLRSLLKQLQFVQDKVAFFNLPALEIDVDVAGLMVIRGVTFHLSSLTLVAHGIELGLKMSDDMEIAIHTEEVRVALFRRIDVSDVYANLKGGEYEMTFHELEEDTRRPEDGEPLMDTDTPLLRAATFASDMSLPPLSKKLTMTEEMTDGHEMKDSSAQAGLEAVTQVSPDDAEKHYSDMMDWLKETSPIDQCYQELKALPHFNEKNLKEVRAAICSKLQESPTVPHPPTKSVKVSTLRNITPNWQREFMHRLPLLLRLLLCPLSYFHPIGIKSITAAGSGKWITHMLMEHVFKQYGQVDAEIRRLQARVFRWLADANFALELLDIEGFAQVPIFTDFDINAYLAFGDVLAYRTVPEEVTQKEVVRLGGADASFTVPSFLLPHHEHILPDVPTKSDVEQLEQDVREADGQPKTIQAEGELEQAKRDETNIRMAVHASLPACLDQELLNFVTTLIKATKVIEVQNEVDTHGDESVGFKDFAKTLNRKATDEEKEASGFRSFAKSLNKSAQVGMKKAVVGGIVNDRWIAKMVGKITKKLETAQGDVGYSGNIPVALEQYRPAKGVTLPSKLLA